MRTRKTHTPDTTEQHRNWLSLIDISGPFLSLTVLKQVWPALESIEKPERQRLRTEHAQWLDDQETNQEAWLGYILRDLLGWGNELHRNGLESLAVDVSEYELQIAPSFALVEPGEDPKPATTRLIGWVCEPGQQPTARVPGDTWAATPVDRVARLCRHHDIQLGLATDGRWWALVWAPRGEVTTTAVFDAVAWTEASERDVVRAFLSLLQRRRFFGVPEDEQLPALLKDSQSAQEDITEALGIQVRRAVEMLVTAIGRADTEARERGEEGLTGVDAHDIYRASVSVMMRVVFLLFAEERGLLPSDNAIYARSYAISTYARDFLEPRVSEASEDDLAHTYRGWHRLHSVFNAIYYGFEHPRLSMPGHDGSLFDPEAFPWLPMYIDDRTVLHMLRSLQYVETGKGRSKERRSLSFRSLDVEQIGYVYEGLLSYDALRADDVVIGLTGKEGYEDEVRLRDLEALAATCRSVTDLAEAIGKEHKDSGIGTARSLGKKLAPLSGADKETARKDLLAVVRGDAALADRLMPFYQIIRKDLRDLPVVVMPGEVFVTESKLRATTGTHYTPRHLADEVVEHALEPLVYSPGPLQTEDRKKWRLKSSTAILDLNVADIAMGSAAFLVAAARYLGKKLIEAWTEEGNPRISATSNQIEAIHASEDEDPLVITARRMIIEHCLYGADINAMAVEMAKLSLWLVSMDPARPFTFLDDRLVTGDSLLGVTSVEQIEYLHTDPKEGRKVHEKAIVDWISGVRELVAEVAEDRKRIAAMDGSTLEGLNRKRKALAETDEKLDRVRLYAGLTVGAALNYSPRKQSGLREGSVKAADLVRRGDTAMTEARDQADEWLSADQPTGSFPRTTLHWPLAFPEVFERGGFDAVVGNPPFLGGQKLTGSLGVTYREYLVNCLGGGVRGSADLIAYFGLRAHSVINPSGQTALIATNTYAQGDTREVGLDQLIANGVTIRRAIKSQPWPSKSAALEMCAVWTSRAKVSDDQKRWLDGVWVPKITSSLDAASRVDWQPKRLAANQGIAFQGSNILGLGFTMTPERAQELITKDPRNKDVLFPYLNGQDLNSSPTFTPSRWVINFHDWPEAKAREYTEPFEQVVREVKPERAKNKDKRRREIWWRFTRPAPELYGKIAPLDKVIVIAQTSRTVMPALVITGTVFSHKIVAFATSDAAMLAFLSSGVHYWWALKQASTLKADLSYTPSDVLQTLPLPRFTGQLRELGNRLGSYRQDVMLARNSGLTATYNLMFDPGCRDEDIEELRAIHCEIDEAAIRAYGWEDRIAEIGGLDHGFHPVGRETRYTIGPAAQREVLDSLLELNRERYLEEAENGLHEKASASAKPTLF